MDLNAITINSIDIGASTPQSSTGSHARSISPARREQYRAEGRCVRCGSYKHWVKDCLLQPFTARQKRELELIDAGKRIGTNPGRMVIAALDDDAYDSDDPRHLDAWQRNIFET
jgi:hypothetical protein